jgi:hypothetical protein
MTMMKTRIVWTKIWEDDWFQSLSDPAQKLFLYLITNSRINMCGCYQVSERILLFDTRIKNLEKVKEELLPKVRFYKDWIYILNAETYSGFRGSKNEKVLIKEKSTIPSDVKNTLFNDKVYRVSENNDTVSSKVDTTINNKSEIINKKYNNIESLNDTVISEVANEYSVSFVDVKNKVESIRLYCKSNGKNYKDYKATLQTWIRNDIEKGKIRKRIAPPQLVEHKLLSPEEKEKALKKLEQVRKENPLFVEKFGEAK